MPVVGLLNYLEGKFLYLVVLQWKVFFIINMVLKRVPK